MLLVIVGAVVSVYTPGSMWWRLILFGVFVLLAIAGFIINQVQYRRAEIAEKQTEIAEQEARDALKQNRAALDALRTSFPMRPPSVIASATIERSEESKRRILATLTTEYILIYGEAGMSVQSGAKVPPAGWLNGRLKEIGEDWRVG